MLMLPTVLYLLKCSTIGRNPLSRLFDRQDQHSRLADLSRHATATVEAEAEAQKPCRIVRLRRRRSPKFEVRSSKY